MTMIDQWVFFYVSARFKDTGFPKVRENGELISSNGAN